MLTEVVVLSKLRNMKGQMVLETTVKVAAEEFWEVYDRWALEPQGDRGVGSIVSIANPPGVFSF